MEPRLCLCLPDASGVVSDFTEKKKYRKSESKEEGEDQASIQSSTTPDPGHRIGKGQKHQKTQYTREPIGQPFPHQVATRLQGTGKTTLQRNLQKDPQKKHRLGTVSTKILEGLNIINATNLLLNSDVDQDT